MTYAIELRADGFRSWKFEQILESPGFSLVTE